MKSKFPLFGVLLIVVGGVMLLQRTGVVDVGWHLVFWTLVTAAGAFKIVRGFTSPASGGQFWGTIFFGVGLTFVLEHLGLVWIPGPVGIPLLLLLVGAAFLVKFAALRRDWHLLIPGVLFAGLGSSLLFSEMGWFPDWDLLSPLATYWPVVLILFGTALLLNRRSA